MIRQIWRGALVSLLTAFLLLSACDNWDIGWPKNIGSGSSSGSGDAFAQTAGSIEYLVVFTCGSNPAGLQDPVVPGQYGTMINIYNPRNNTISVSMRVSLSIPPGAASTGDISGFVTRNISSNRALEEDCDTIRSDFVGGSSSSLHSGFLSVSSSTPVEIVATYTAGRVDSVNSIHVERILPR